jgi:hypothetical protein
MLTKTEGKNKILIEYSLNGNNVSVVRIFNVINKGLAFQFDNDNNEYKITKHSYYKKIGPAMKQFNEAVKALKQGTNIT